LAYCASSALRTISALPSFSPRPFCSCTLDGTWAIRCAKEQSRTSAIDMLLLPSSTTRRLGGGALRYSGAPNVVSKPAESSWASAWGHSSDVPVWRDGEHTTREIARTPLG